MSENKETRGNNEEEIHNVLKNTFETLSTILDEQEGSKSLIWSIISEFCNKRNYSKEPNEVLNEIFGAPVGDVIIMCIVSYEKIDDFMNDFDFKHQIWLKALSYTFTEPYLDIKRFQNAPRSLRAIVDYEDGNDVHFVRADEVSVSYELNTASCIFVIRRMLDIIEAKVGDSNIILDRLEEELKRGLGFVEEYKSKLGEKDDD
ncbi:hypothetical protein [Paenibacillus daejeonensis]|uniref:hypothetical protein n=1 Tax=Paenibacillus daejeonensis TaxID=135193 RepID=UPI00036B88A9|nr:hypothetical protein [Paenibacillus daejeonensis]